MKAIGKATLMSIMIEQQRIVRFHKEIMYKESIKKELNEEEDRHSIEPSEGSDPSGQVIVESSIIVEHELYWIESMGLWGCKHCSLKADKFGMENTPCKGNKRAK